MSSYVPYLWVCVCVNSFIHCMPLVVVSPIPALFPLMLDSISFVLHILVLAFCMFG